MSSNIRKLVLCWLFFYAVFSVQAYIRPYNERNVFQSDSSYCYRIPSMVRTNNGTLVAVAEGRETDCGDYGDVDIVVRRSTDNGNTWGNTILIDSFGSSRLHNPCPVVDQRTNRVYVF
ncbi:MAG: sialidase family protein, partial [Phycisphaerales bacterium]